MVAGRFRQDDFITELFDTLGLCRPERLDRAVTKRLAEFVAGRAMARIAQEALGCVARPVGIAESRAPIWPSGLAGSISHTRDFCACLLLPEDAGNPGIDVEVIASGSALLSIEQLAITGRDRVHLLTRHVPSDVAATLCFSAKEALYKALYPTVRSYFGFDDVEMARPLGRNTISLRLTKSLHATLPSGAVFDLSWEIGEGRVMTWMQHSR